MVGSAILRALKKRSFKDHRILTANRKVLNLANKDEVENWFEINKPNVVILAAGKVGGIYANSHYPSEFLLENIKIQNNVIETACKKGVHRLLFLGSSCIYPKSSRQPIKEEYLMTGELEKTNKSYAIAKIAGIQLCDSLREQYGFDAISVMPTNLYGPGDNYNPSSSHVLPALIRKFYDAKQNNISSVTCWGTGSPLREFLHVDDLGDACLFLLENWDPNEDVSPKDENSKPFTLLNVGTGLDISIKNIALKLAELIGYEGEVIWDSSKPDGTMKKQLDVSRINKLGWTAKIPLEIGLRSTIFDYENELNSKLLRY